MKAVNLKSDHMVNPIGLSFTHPTLSWICLDGIQKAYEVEAFVSGACVWKSGKVDSSENHVRSGYEGKSRDHVLWRVRLWDGETHSEWSEAFYEMGLLCREDWKGLWIDPEPEAPSDERKPSSVLKKKFFIENGIETARLYITCHGLYVARINGKRVGNFVLAPGAGDYRKRLRVQSFDVLNLLQDGENEIEVTLGDGWYRGNVGIDGTPGYYGNDLALLCQLEADSEVVLKSDETWLASQDGPVRLNDMQKGETYDAGKETISLWHPVTVRDCPYSVLTGSDTVPVTEHERFEGRLFRTPDGALVVDFGQNLAGYTEIRVHAGEGQKIVLWHGETLDENGNFTQSNFDPGERNSNGGIPQKLELICREGLNVYKPSFCIFGFRYARVEAEMDLSNASFTAIAVYSEMEQTGFFECSDKSVNRLFLNSLWSMKSNFCDIPTDCPTRERAGWTGDAGVFAPTGVLLSDCYAVFRNWLAECRIAQAPDGLVANIAPVNNKGSMISNTLQGSSGWGDACILVPWELYRTYGDPQILEENYEMMCGWINFVKKRASDTRPANMENPYRDYLVDQGFHFGEWLEPDVSSMETMKNNMMHGAPEVATAYFYRSASLMAEIAGILGKTEDRESFSVLAGNIRKAYRFCCTDDGIISSKRQCEYVRPISFGLLDNNEIHRAADELDRLVKNNSYHLNTGFLSTANLCSVLSDNGHTDTAYRLLLQKECPGWLYAVEKGATTIWETWDGIREDGTVHDSLNHYSYGAVCGFLIKGVCGIRYERGKLIIKPQPEKSFKYAGAKWLSPVGEISSSWKYENDRIIFDIKVPVQADFVAPSGDTILLKPGENHYEILL
ncbi:MAG: glycoside hydrolase family 78 protein [Sphaerochaetaceae bacterium]|nr:glycoside hydrolase family 78 protein [Sphaerochaetaceae bacterium]